MAVGLVGAVAVPLLLLLAGLTRGAARSDAHLTMITLALSQMESVKGQPYLDLPAAYAIVTPVPDGFTVAVTADPVATYAYPEPDAGVVLSDEVQLIAVEVGCPACSPPEDPLILTGYKARR